MNDYICKKKDVMNSLHKQITIFHMCKSEPFVLCLVIRNDESICPICIFFINETFNLVSGDYHKNYKRSVFDYSCFRF